MSIEGYQVEVRKLNADLGGGFVAFVPQLTGCVSDGESAAIALLNLEDAFEMWLDAAREQRRPIPQPILSEAAEALLLGTAANMRVEPEGGLEPVTHRVRLPTPPT
jgi:predicted RNase H-like HicB family nuclease